MSFHIILGTKMAFSKQPIVIVSLLTSMIRYLSNVGHGLRHIFFCCFGE